MELTCDSSVQVLSNSNCFLSLTSSNNSHSDLLVVIDDGTSSQSIYLMNKRVDLNQTFDFVGNITLTAEVVGKNLRVQPIINVVSSEFSLYCEDPVFENNNFKCALNLANKNELTSTITGSFSNSYSFNYQLNNGQVFLLNSYSVSDIYTINVTNYQKNATLTKNITSKSV